jgi:uncharacterized protein YueI
VRRVVPQEYTRLRNTKKSRPFVGTRKERVISVITRASSEWSPQHRAVMYKKQIKPWRLGLHESSQLLLRCVTYGEIASVFLFGGALC